MESVGASSYPSLPCLRPTDSFAPKRALSRLYRGMGAPIVGVTPIFALSFWSYDLGKKLATSFLPNTAPHLLPSGEVSKELTLSQLAFAGFFSAIPTTLVTGPAERVKVLLQVRQPPHAFDAPKSTDSVGLRRTGIRSRTRRSAVLWADRRCAETVRRGRSQVGLPRNGRDSRSRRTRKRSVCPFPPYVFHPHPSTTRLTRLRCASDSLGTLSLTKSSRRL